MSSIPQLSTGYIVATLAAVAVEIVLPLLLAVIARRRLGVGWRYFGIGALVFFLSQIVTRLPLIQGLQLLILPQLQTSTALLWAWLAFAALTAGLFENVGRYLAFRYLMRGEAKTWAKGVMVGLGHGGLESMLLISLLTLVSLLGLLALAGGGLAELPEAQRTVAEAQLAAAAAQPAWLPLLGAWERLAAIAVHVALSVVVLQVFRRGSLAWLWLAIAAHAAFDFVAVAIPQLLGRNTTGLLVTEAALTVVGLISLWVIWRLREAPAPGAPAAEERAYSAAP